jgi:hypothetical protein
MTLPSYLPTANGTSTLGAVAKRAESSGCLENGRVMRPSALLTDTYSSPLRAQGGAAKRGR